MHERVAAGEHTREPRAVEEVDALVSHLGAALAQLARHVAPDEAGRAGDVDLHVPRAVRTRPSARIGQTSR